jgi:hypothetical protein
MLLETERFGMDDKKYVVCQNKWILTPALAQAHADYEKVRLSEWFTGLMMVEVSMHETSQQLEALCRK